MKLLEYYTDDYDSYENIVNNGMSDKTYVSDIKLKVGKEYKDLKEAIKEIDAIDDIVIYYQKHGVQYFKKFYNTAP